jgi:hypothetical protein
MSYPICVPPLIENEGNNEYIREKEYKTVLRIPDGRYHIKILSRLNGFIEISFK